jgi:phytoene dehydrogenase-like protein
MNNCDVVVVGAGHNSLTAAAYLAAAGLKVSVVEKNGWVGGGAVTRELTAPGFKHDVHSNGHIFIQANPMISRDELGLMSRFGLEYITPPVYFSSVFPDGSVLQTFASVDDSCKSIAQFSTADADAYRRFVQRAEKMLPVFAVGLFNPPLPFTSMAALLEQSSEGRDFLSDMNLSIFDVVNDLFESDKVKIHFLRWAAEGMVSPETKGTGTVLHLMCTFTHKYNAIVPKGGSGELSNALVRCVESHGGSVETGVDIDTVVMEGGRATGVVAKDGRTYRAKKAVIACIHPHKLKRYLGANLDEAVGRRAARTQLSDFSAMCTHFALNSPPKFKYGNDLHKSFAVETQPGSMVEFRELFDDYKYGRIPRHKNVLACTTSTIDPSRAPEGKATLYLYTFMPYALSDGGAARWDEVKEQVADWTLDALRDVTTNMGDENIIARHVNSPLDHERDSDSFERGDIVGLGMFNFQFAGQRPTPELANYAVPGIAALYLAGPFMHPAGGIIGGGRPLAIKMMRDLKIDTSRLSVA